MRVLKFGGSSVANSQNMEKVLSIVRDSLQENERVFVVLSAMGGITDSLLQAAELALQKQNSYQNILEIITLRHLSAVKELISVHHQSRALTAVKELCNEMEDICKGVFLVGELTPHTRDSISSYGELLSTFIFSEVLHQNQISNTWCDARKIIQTDGGHGKAVVDMKATSQRIEELLQSPTANCLVFPGFIGSDKNGHVTTLGRGGSDYTASVIAAAVKAREVQIWTDVSGMMTADPGLVKNARIISEISYAEALELSHFGAKVIYPRTIAPAMVAKVAIAVKNTFEPWQPGTVIHDGIIKNGSAIRGISSMKKMAVLTLEGSGMIGSPGFSKRLFEALASERVNVVLITQSSSEYSICVVVEEEGAEVAKEAVDAAFAWEIEMNKVNPLIVERSLAIVALVGDNMKSRAGVSGKMFGALGRNGINVRAIAQGSSERNISAVIAEIDVKKALNVLHEEFFENTYKQVNLFVCGTGNVGKKLLEQLQGQQQYLREKMHVQIKVAALSNSRKMYFSESGVDLENWQQLLEEGEAMVLDKFMERMKAENRRNSVFADITANEKVAEKYPELLKKSISVVACNKIACSSGFNHYNELKNLAALHQVSFLFETNVGAGLPVIGTLNDLLRSGDEVVKIEAVLSGTLNFVFNDYTGEKPFAESVRLAAKEGFTEPDPRLDLSGIDVMRKILILSREAGYQLELQDIENHSFMPPECMEGNIDNFYKQMENHEKHFANLVAKAKSQGKKLKYVATFEGGKASAGLKEIDSNHDFYHLYGKDNVVLFYTHRYSQQPLVIKGAGAGAEVTASGVFADILRTVK